MPFDSPNAYLSLLDDLLSKARAAGADSADALVVESQSLGASVRLGAREDLERSESRDLGLRVMIGRRQAIASSNDFSATALSELARRVVDMARAAPEDPWCGLADAAALCSAPPALDLADDHEPDIDSLYERAAACEAAARAVPGVSNSEGGSAGWGRNSVALVTSHGFSGAYAATSHSVSASVLAGEGTAMERDYEFDSARHFADLRDVEAVGREAGERAVRRLNPRKLESGPMPVVFDPRVSRSLIGHLTGAISGAAVARGTSFLKERMGEAVFAAGIRIVDDPHRPRGLASKPFDGEGVANARTVLIEDGRLTTWLLDSATARQLGLATTGHAARGTGGPPGPSSSNTWMEAGTVSPEALIAQVGEGLYVTELIGFGVNAVTGDYSRGAAGFRIAGGALAEPVSEITIAGNLIEMFARATPADDLAFRYGSNAPTLRIDGLTVAGA